MPTVEEACLGAYSTCVSQALKVSSLPCTTRKNACCSLCVMGPGRPLPIMRLSTSRRSEEHTSELQSQSNLVCRLLLEKKKKNSKHKPITPVAYRTSMS